MANRGGESLYVHWDNKPSRGSGAHLAHSVLRPGARGKRIRAYSALVFGIRVDLLSRLFPNLGVGRRDGILRRAIGRLPRKQAEVIDLVYYHGNSIAEVAQILGIPENTVKTRMQHARKKLATWLEAEQLIDPPVRAG
jgi:DNA-binding CsgD family transcriptional regulator